MKKPNVAILGATGAVGAEFITLIEERNFPYENLKLLASARSAGTELTVNGKTYVVEDAKPESFANIDVVPEVNPEDILKHKGIIANPNCSTIIMSLGLKPLHDISPIKRIVVSTYQAVSGAGKEGIEELENQVKQYTAGEEMTANLLPTGSAPKHYPVAFNLLPQIDVFLDNDYTKEEMKMVHESQKILHDDTIQVVPTTVRVPVYRSHSESVLVETEEPVSVEAFKAACEKFPGLQVKDNPAEQIYPMPLYTSNQNDCEIGRIRKDLYNDKGMNFWIVGDQIRKGAALNALQIAEYLVEKQAF
ncbi:MAG: aspartate-semialdehyde dehydrogenase [Veillonella sp.]|nr:aspartate-semialdehyde dehydrogenase [Veillonella sp.]